MSTTYTSYKEAVIPITYICSCCIGVIRLDIHIKANASSLSQAKAEQIASKALSNETKDFLLFLKNPGVSEHIPFNHSRDHAYVSITGLSESCPICKAHESWQSNETLSLFKLGENSPVIHSNDGEANRWVKKIMRGRIANYEAILSNAAKVNELKKKKESLSAQLESFKSDLDSGAPVRELQIMQKKREELSNNIKSYSLFSAERGEEKKKIEALDIQIRDQKAAVEQLKKSIEERIPILEKELYEINDIFAQYTNYAVRIRGDNSTAYVLEKAGGKQSSDKMRLTETTVAINNSSPFISMPVIREKDESGASSNANLPKPSNSEQPAKAKYCHKCGFRLLENSKFCSKCGTPIPISEIRCPSCSTILPKGSTFCHKCGTKI